MDKTTNVDQVNESGDNVGGNKIVHVYNGSQTKHYRLRQLFEEYTLEKKSGERLQDFIEDLEMYTTNKDSTVIGLEQKLKNGNRLSIVDYALLVKERYAKKLYRKYSFYQSSQEINVYLLALVEDYYMRFVYPKVCDGASESEIENMIQTYIVEPFLEAVEGDTLGFNIQDIIGMLYYLTGNCHIKWTK